MKKKKLKKDYAIISSILEKAGLDVKVKKVERLGGMTNRSYHIFVKHGKDLLVRIPGEGTQEIISRKDERVSRELAFQLGIDIDMLYFGENGEQVSLYIEDAYTFEAKDMRKSKHIKEIAKIFRTLHHSGVDTKVPFEVFDMAEEYEHYILENNVALYPDYEQVKAEIMDMKESIDAMGTIEKVPCHNDSLCANWVYGNDRLYLVDWEYAGMNDPMWDLADVSIEAEFSDKEDFKLLKKYFGRKPDEFKIRRFVANKIYLDYLWTLWGLTRVPFDGELMQEYADNRYKRLELMLEKLGRVR